MGVLNKVFKTLGASIGIRSLENPSTSLANPAEWLGDLWGGTSSSGIQVGPESSLKFSAVYACVRVLSEAIASLPVHVYERTSNGKNKAINHETYQLVHNSPNTMMTSFQFMELGMMHTLLWGNFYAKITRNGGMRGAELVPIMPSDVTPFVDNGEIFYKVREDNRKVVYDSDEIFHIQGPSTDWVKGKSIISYARDNIGLGLSAQEFGSHFFGNGTHLGAIITYENQFTDTNKLKERLKLFNQSYQGVSKAGKTAMLDGNAKFHQLGMPLSDAQFIETRKFQVTEIARWFRVPPHMIADLERSTHNNIEHQGIEFVQHSLRPWLVRWEQEYNRKLFRADERGTYFVKFNINGLLRGDNKARSEYYRTMLDMGVMTINEVRELEDMNRGGEELDKHLVQLARTDINALGNNEGREEYNGNS